MLQTNRIEATYTVVPLSKYHHPSLQKANKTVCVLEISSQKLKKFRTKKLFILEIKYKQYGVTESTAAGTRR